MYRLRHFVFAGMMLALLCVHPASAQTVANLVLVSGNGQMAGYCLGGHLGAFQPLLVKAVDSNGNVIPNASINWALTVGTGLLSDLSNTDTTTTGADGTTQETYGVAVVPTGTPAQPYLQATIVASANSGTPSVTFSLTTVLCSQQSDASLITLNNPTIGGTDLYLAPRINGQAGTTGTTPIQAFISNIGGTSNGVPNVALRLLSNQASPGVSCATGANADPGAVLTANDPGQADNGKANCYPVFSGSGTGQYYVLIGAAAQSTASNNYAPLGYASYGPYNMTVTPPAPGQIQPVSGAGQSGNPGQTLSAPLVAEVTDVSGLNPIPSQQVIWTVIPDGAAHLSGFSNLSDANGLVQATVTLGNTVTGTVQIKVSLQNNPNIFYIFSVGANTVLTGLQKVSGDSQIASVNTLFGQPLVVQVNSSLGPVSNYAVQFAVSGPGQLTSSSNPTTNASGQAQVTVMAGSTPGSLTVTATAGSYSQTFTLTVSPAAPILTAANFFNGVSLKQGVIAPCGIATIGPGVANGTLLPSVPFFGPLPYTLSNVSVSFNNLPAPIYSVATVNGQTQITVQVPCELATSPSAATNVPVAVMIGGGTANVTVPVLAAAPGILETIGSDGVSRAVIVRADGSFASLTNPARLGEQVRAYVTGLGATLPAVATDSIADPGADALGFSAAVQGTVVVGVTNSSGGGGGATLIGARYAPDLIGIYEVTFQIPNNAATGNNVTFSLGVIPAGASQTSIPISANSRIAIQ